MNSWASRTCFVAVLASAIWLLADHPKPLHSQVPGVSPTLSTPQMMELQPGNDGVRRLVVFDGSSGALAIYHIDGQAGRLELRSVRNIRYDLKLEEFNATSPLPSELRKLNP